MKRVGLALGSGAARGLAHIGVLDVLQREGIPIDMIAGTSAGAVVGALYAQDKDTRVIKELAASMSWRQLAPLVDLALPKTGFIEGRKIKRLLKSIIGDIEFSGLKIPLACVAADIITGEEVVIDRGSVLEAVRASISIPVIFTVVRWQGRYLVDGGLVNPVPASVLKRMGADVVIAVNVIPAPVKRVPETVKSREPSVINVMMQSVYISSYLLVASCLKEADIVIEPQVVDIGPVDFSRTQECIQRGEEAAQKAIPEIRQRLEA